ncbi:MAG: sigma-70 family RNA polymerase sigma factor [Blastocatellia bacterium]
MNVLTAEKLEEFETTALGYASQLFRVALRLERDYGKAEDLVQETFLHAWRSFHRFESGTNLRAWLYKIMFNRYYSQRRRDKLALAPMEEMIAETLAYDPPTPQYFTDEDVIAAVDRIPRDYQLVVVLADVEDLSYREIAEALDIPMGTVMSRLHRGRKILRTELAAWVNQGARRSAE